MVDQKYGAKFSIGNMGGFIGDLGGSVAGSVGGLFVGSGGVGGLAGSAAGGLIGGLAGGPWGLLNPAGQAFQGLYAIGTGIEHVAESVYKSAEDLVQAVIKIVEFLFKLFKIILILVERSLPLLDMLIFAAPVIGMIMYTKVLLELVNESDLPIPADINKLINAGIVAASVWITWFIYSSNGLSWNTFVPDIFKASQQVRNVAANTTVPFVPGGHLPNFPSTGVIDGSKYAITDPENRPPSHSMPQIGKPGSWSGGSDIIPPLLPF